MLPFDAVLLASVGFLVGIIASMVGVGGGVFIVPFLSIVFEFTSQEAVGSSLAVVVFTSVASTFAYSKQKRIDYKVGLVSAVTTVPGAVLGAYLTTLVSSRLLGLVFAFFLVFVALRMATDLHVPFLNVNLSRWHRRLVDSEGEVFEHDADVMLGFVLAFFGGLSSGLLGTGGGAIMVPILHLAVNQPMHVAVATSMFIMIFTSIAGVLTHMRLDNVKFEYSACIAFGVIFGAQLGARISRNTSGKILRGTFSIVLLIVSIRLLLKFI